MTTTKYTKHSEKMWMWRDCISLMLIILINHISIMMFQITDN